MLVFNFMLPLKSLYPQGATNWREKRSDSSDRWQWDTWCPASRGFPSSSPSLSLSSSSSTSLSSSSTWLSLSSSSTSWSYHHHLHHRQTEYSSSKPQGIPPTPGREPFSPVIFLNLNADDLSTGQVLVFFIIVIINFTLWSRCSWYQLQFQDNDDQTPVYGVNSILPKVSFMPFGFGLHSSHQKKNMTRIAKAALRFPAVSAHCAQVGHSTPYKIYIEKMSWRRLLWIMVNQSLTCVGTYLIFVTRATRILV